MDVCTNLFFSQDFESLIEVLDVCADIQLDVLGMSGPKGYSLGCFFVPGTVDAENYYKTNSPDNICVTEVITQMNSIPQN